jgi:hypothetical protein
MISTVSSIWVVVCGLDAQRTNLQRIAEQDRVEGILSSSSNQAPEGRSRDPIDPFTIQNVTAKDISSPITLGLYAICLEESLPVLLAGKRSSMWTNASRKDSGR